MHPQALHAVNSALSYLYTLQHTDGSFHSYTSPWRYAFDSHESYKTTFANAVILEAISQVDLPSAAPLQNLLSQYLLSQISLGGSVNYWDNTSAEYTALPYPDDLDDTFYTLSALHRHKASTITGDMLAKAIYILTQSEHEPGGPYRTWVTKTDATTWNDCDVAVNANILYFLKNKGIEQSKLLSFIEQAVKTNRYRSPYYPSSYPLIFFIARSIPTPSAAVTHYAKQLARLQPPQSALEHALLACTYQELGEITAARKHLKYLIKTQGPNGSWPAAAFCIDPQRNGQRQYNGSASITTALAIRALVHEPVAATATHATRPRYADNALLFAQRQLKNLDPAVKNTLHQQLQKIGTSHNANEIITSPYTLYVSLPSQQPSLDKATLYALSSANMYGWIAYTLYDDFIDEDNDGSLLPVANIAHRLSVRNFLHATNKHQFFHAYIAQIFDRIDAANAWEITFCRAPVDNSNIVVKRFPQYGNHRRIAEKSIGHALPFLSVALLHNPKQYHNYMSDLEQVLSQYLIARQLHDDAHDWREDLQKGHLSPVVVRLLKLHRITGSHNLAILTEQLQDSYWRIILPTTCKRIQLHLMKARHTLDNTPYANCAIGTLIEKLEDTTTRTLQQQTETVLFLDTYTKLSQDRDRPSNN